MSEVEDLRAERDQLKVQLDRLATKQHVLEAECAGWKNRATQFAADADDMRQEVERLRRQSLRRYVDQDNDDDPDNGETSVLIGMINVWERLLELNPETRERIVKYLVNRFGTLSGS